MYGSSRAWLISLYVEVRGVIEDLREVCCVPQPATVFRRCGASAVDTQGDGSGLVRRKDRL
jgi:hypothetical protein